MTWINTKVRAGSTAMTVCCFHVSAHTHQLSFFHFKPAGDARETLDQSKGCPLHPQALQKTHNPSMRISQSQKTLENQQLLMPNARMHSISGRMHTISLLTHSLKETRYKHTSSQTPTFRCRSGVRSYIFYHHSCSTTYAVSQHACQYTNISQGHSDRA